MTTRLERVLIAIIIILIPIIVFAFLSFDFHNERICMSTSCMKTAVRILNSMDHSVNPCDDFYMFACGNYLKENFIPDDKFEISAFSEIDHYHFRISTESDYLIIEVSLNFLIEGNTVQMSPMELLTGLIPLRETLYHKMRILLEELPKTNEIKPFKFMKTQYQHCMNSSQDNLGTLKYILRQLGGWPVLEGENWGDHHFDWQNLTHKLRKSGLYSDVFLVIRAEVMKTNSSYRILEVDAPSVIFREYLKNGWNDRITEAMYGLMVDITVLLGADRLRAEEEMKNVMKFLLNLVQITISPEEKQIPSSSTNLMTINDLELTFPIVKWQSYINNQLLGITTVDENSKINVLYPQKLKKINALIIHSEKRTLANYIMWAAFFEEIQYTNQQLRERLNRFLKMTAGNILNNLQWKNCVDEAITGFPLIAGSLYVRRFFKKRAKEDMIDLVDSIRLQFKQELAGLQWMNQESRKKAMMKINHFTTFIGYPDELLNDKKMLHYFNDLGEPPENYLLLHLRLRNFTRNTHFSFLSALVDRNDWRKQQSPIEINAFHEKRSNSIQFPAGILQETFFDHEGPNYVNFGRTGVLIGHQIIHGFDHEGKLFDENGSMVGWWTDETKYAYAENVLCIVEQYSNITVPEADMKINGVYSQGENIADNGGIKHAYLSYLHWLSNNGPDRTLPGLSTYSNRQMFWISSATAWCSRMRQERLKALILSEQYVPISYRINIPLSNSEYFAEDFKCPLESKMNPVTKCKVF